MKFIKLSINNGLEQIININDILQLIKGEDYIGLEFTPSYTLVLKSCGPSKITENVYNQIKEKIKDLTI